MCMDAQPTGIDRKDVEGVNNVKVVDRNMNALYFSRAIIPHNKTGTYDPKTKYLRKLGIYSYRADFLPGVRAHAGIDVANQRRFGAK